MSIGHAWEPDMFEGPHALTTPIRYTTDPSSYRREALIMSAWIDTCRGRALIRDAVHSAAWDHAYDPWGSGMLALGVLVDAAFFLGVDVDPAIATPAMGIGEGGEWITYEEFEQARDVVEAIQEGQATVADLEHGIRWVNRYLDLPAVAARRY